MTSTTWTRPDFKLPEPQFEFLFHLECDMEEFHQVSDHSSLRALALMGRDWARAARESSNGDL